MPRETKVRRICCETINHRQYRTLTSETDCFLLEARITVAVSFGSKRLTCQFLLSSAKKLSQKNAYSRISAPSDWFTDFVNYS